MRDDKEIVANALKLFRCCFVNDDLENSLIGCIPLIHLIIATLTSIHKDNNFVISEGFSSLRLASKRESSYKYFNEKVLKAISLVASNKSLSPNNAKLVCGIVKNL